MVGRIQKLGALLLTGALLLAAAPAAAAGTTPSPESTPASGSSAAAALVIDTGNRYEGMSKTWSQGYVPAVTGGTARVVLPLVRSDQSGVPAILGDTITVKPDYGDAASSPFVFSNIETKVKLAPHAINGTTATVQSWLVSYSLPLETRRVNGRYPLTLHVSYALAEGAEAAQDFTVYVTIRNGIDPNATPKPAATPKPTPKPLPQPKLIVSRYAVEPQVVEAGKQFQLDFDIRNTSDSVAVRNVKITIKTDGTALVPVNGSNTLYVSGLGKSATSKQSFAMKAAFDAEPKPQKVTITVEYEDGNGTAYTAADDLLVQVSQPIRLEFDQPSLAAAVNAGDTVPLNLNVFNMGRTALHNVLCKVAAPGLIPEGSAFLGTMDAGATKTAEMFVYVGTRDMSLDGDGNVVTNAAVTEKYGATEGVINVSFEDDFGNRYTRQVKLGTTIHEPAAPAPTATAAAQATPEAGQWWISVAVAGAVIAAIALAMLFLRRKRAREVAANDEAD